jgi:hypothetical protein
MAMRATENVRGKQGKEGTLTRCNVSEGAALFLPFAFDSDGKTQLGAPLLHLDLKRLHEGANYREPNRRDWRLQWGILAW